MNYSAEKHNIKMQVLELNTKDYVNNIFSVQNLFGFLSVQFDSRCEVIAYENFPIFDLVVNIR